MDKRAQRNIQKAVGFFGIFYILPIALLYFGIIPFRATFAILTLTGIILIAYAVSKPISGRDLGFRKDNLKSALLWSGLINIIGLLAMAFLWGQGILRPSEYYHNNAWFYVYYVLLSAPLQEFIFRSLALYELNSLLKNKDWLKVLISALVFSLAHAAYHSWTVLAITFAIGILWGILYQKHPNFYAVALSHVILGFATVVLGIV